jgi:hypothetical protein
MNPPKPSKNSDERGKRGGGNGPFIGHNGYKQDNSTELNDAEEKQHKRQNR